MITLKSNITNFENWLIDKAIPLQESHVRIDAGFHERISLDGSPVNMPHRARVSARQFFAFSRLLDLGISSQACEPLAIHARDYLLTNHLDVSGAIIPISGGPIAFELYDVAFILFALAAAPEDILPRTQTCKNAAAILNWLEKGWRHPNAGFEEAQPRTLPLRSNPHMHIFEASLEWMSTGNHDADFARIADEIAELCLSRFLASDTGALRELFDGDWQSLESNDNYVEPGHQYEWGWLMCRWGKLRNREDAIAAGIRLIDIAETKGLNDLNLAGTSLNADLSPADMTARLWPQTERIKAWALRAQMAIDATEKNHAINITKEACTGLMHFFDHPLPGSWWENLQPNGKSLPEPARTSSFYHIVGAYIELHKLKIEINSQK